MKIQIKSVFGSVLFSNDAETLRDAVVAAVKVGANLGGANLGGANLRSANLRSADLRGADLRDANLYGANLRGADLYGANLGNADLRGADLGGANLRDANLYGADLRGANLYGADLGGAHLGGANNIDKLQVAQLSIVPEHGSFIGWKLCRDGVVVKLRIPEDAARSNATGRKCRASKAEVLEIIGDTRAVSGHDSGFTYNVGQTVVPHEWNPDRWVECGGGIHFFLTRIEAEQYV